MNRVVKRIIAMAGALLLSLLSSYPAQEMAPVSNAVPPATAAGEALVPAASGSPADLPASAVTNPAIPELWFPVGEELTYYIMWGRLLVGRATIITAWGRHQDKPVIKISYWVRSNKTLSRLYPVQDLIVTTVDPVTFRPIRFDMDMKEGKVARREVTVFDYEAMTATWTSLTKKKTKTFPIEKDTRDLMTFMYFVRSQELKKSDDKSWRVMADDKIYDLNVKIPAEERVELPKYGKVKCLRIEPTAQFEGLFVRSGKMTLWLSNDPRRLCTRVEAEVPVGSVRAILNRVQGPGQDFWISNISHTNSPSAGVPVITDD